MEIDLLAVIMWLIWGRRNAARLDDSILEYHQIRSKVEVHLLDQTISKASQWDHGGNLLIDLFPQVYNST